MRAVVLDLGHTGRTGGRPPAEHAGLSERRIVWRYATAAALELDRAGVLVELAGMGRYADRQRYAALTRARAYVACHVNAGHTDGFPTRSAVFHTPSGLRLAEALATAVSPLSGGARLYDVTRTGWAHGPRALLRRVETVPGVVYEPGWLDSPAHAHLWQGGGPERLGEALAAGLLEWLGA